MDILHYIVAQNFDLILLSSDYYFKTHKSFINTSITCYLINEIPIFILI